MTEKIKTQAYNFLSENKSIEDIKKQPNITFKEKRRHGGKTFKLIETYNANNQLVNDDTSENEIFYDAIDDLNNIPTKEISQSKIIIQEQAKEIQLLKKQIEELKQSKQDNINFNNFKYSCITIYDKKQGKKIGIEKIYEEILPINNEIYFITTFQNTNKSITEEIIYFLKLTNGNVEVINQVKKYENINDYMNEYKDNFLLIEKQAKQRKKIGIESVSIKDFLNQQNEKKRKPSNKQWIIWGIFTTIFVIVPIICAFLPFVWPSVTLVLINKIVISAFLVTIGIVGKFFSWLFSPINKKVDSWLANKIIKNEELKEKNKKERELIIKNLTCDKLETKLETQFKILKQELDNRKEKNPDKIISNKTINHNSNNISENLNIESKNNQDFDSSIRNTVNQQDQPSTSTRIYYSNSML